MITTESEKVIIVEGLTDKRQIEKVINDDVTIVCTNGTLGVERLDEMLETYRLDDRDVFILVDEDHSGMKLRKQLARELPHADHIYVSSEYREVATTPEHVLATTLVSKHFSVNPLFLVKDVRNI
ncbi:toprim domain-containing protein [Oceanobacillus salinisoli]|uniref:toprim domain-containing protein n=1 Tax=Oceanobacillus salinisoli TaxID=2678611 RepID=UPI0012E2A333|nr:toprim domain-containing protein [Oceanobacillus salinisoli]